MRVTTLTTLFICCFGMLKTGNSQSGNQASGPPDHSAEPHKLAKSGSLPVTNLRAATLTLDRHLGAHDRT
jgi:hypothetical protein